MDNFDLKKYLVENKVTTNSKMLDEAATDSVDKALDNPKVKAIGKELASDPAKLAKMLKQAGEMGVDIQALKQAAQAFAAGKSVDTIVGDEVDALKTSLNEEESGKSFGTKVGAAIGGTVGLFAGAGLAPLVIPAALVGALIFGLAGRGIGKSMDKLDADYKAGKLNPQQDKPHETGTGDGMNSFGDFTVDDEGNAKFS